MSTDCAACAYFRAATNGYHLMCPRHEWEEMQRRETIDGNLDKYFAEEDARRKGPIDPAWRAGVKP